MDFHPSKRALSIVIIISYDIFVFVWDFKNQILFLKPTMNEKDSRIVRLQRENQNYSISCWKWNFLKSVGNFVKRDSFEKLLVSK